MQIIEYLWKKLELMVNFLTELFSKLVNRAVILFQDDSQIAIGCYRRKKIMKATYVLIVILLDFADYLIYYTRKEVTYELLTHEYNYWR